MANKNETFHPMYYYEGIPLFTKGHVKHLFEQLKANNESLIVQFKGDPLSLKLHVRKAYPNFVLMDRRIVVSGVPTTVPYTISYSEVISQDVHILGKKGSLKPWMMSVTVPEPKNLTESHGN